MAYGFNKWVSVNAIIPKTAGFVASTFIPIDNDSALFSSPSQHQAAGT